MRAVFLTVVAIVTGLGCAGQASESTRSPEDGAELSGEELLKVHLENEEAIDGGSLTKARREEAYRSAQGRDDGSADYAFARAAIAGRMAELRGLSAVGIVKEVETYARLCLQRNPDYRNGEAKRMLATLYVMAESHVEHGDSEVGLEMLEELAESGPSNPANHFRLGEAYLFFGDTEEATGPICEAVEQRTELRRSQQRALESLMQEENISCEGVR